MKCYIYKIYSDVCDEVYIGSTNDFKRRLRDHKSRCNNENNDGHNFFIYQFIRQNGGWDNFKSSILWEGDVKDKYEKMKIEGEYMKEYDKTLNSHNSHGCKDSKEYYEENKEKIKEYREANKVKRKEKMKKYHQANKEKINDKKKEYYQANKEKIKEKMKEYAKQRVQCPHCNKKIRRDGLSKHIKTQHI